MPERTAHDYEMVVGLEIHVELKTRSKAFCGCAVAYAAPPNTHVCPVCMGLPGALPTFNAQALRLAALAGLALHCRICRESCFDRKNYFYPDLPKAYQVTQFFHPLCRDGYLSIRATDGEKRIGITRIHIEEDAGKLIHDDARGTLLDMNRCGVPLIEIVTQPDLKSAEEAVAFFRKLRTVIVCAGVSDGRMNEGNLRCDVNVSVRRPGAPLGVRTEIKNLNSFRSVERAINAEYARQTALLMAGQPVMQETRRFDEKTGQTVSMRRKENSADYRYFPEPDLPALVLSDEEVDALRESLPALPDARRRAYADQFGLTPHQAELLSVDPDLADFFERAATVARSPAGVAKLLLGECSAQLRSRGDEDVNGLPFAPERLAALSDLLGTGRVNSSTGKRILAAMFDADVEPAAYAEACGWLVLSDEEELRKAVRHALDDSPAMVERYRAGRTNVARALMGKAMAATAGRADAEKLSIILLEELSKE